MCSLMTHVRLFLEGVIRIWTEITLEIFILFFFFHDLWCDLESVSQRIAARMHVLGLLLYICICLVLPGHPQSLFSHYKLAVF